MKDIKTYKGFNVHLGKFIILLIKYSKETLMKLYKTIAEIRVRKSEA
jgi:hypothetical protein